ncbi:hypothetical protein F511_46559 [Dorcoceras hygrometricum]|uniref:Uncharacterized protein n=1 Tax=Dorcoceras hygrometricum TaxID=472368 RepID=A0A2Z6ZT81_9LAMI|nr:hypothetical protein F511_46559 [Dorcoceras hygrometricum]
MHLDAFEIAHLLNSQRKAQNAAFPLIQTTPLLNASIAHLLISSKQYNAITISSKHYVTPTSSYLSTALATNTHLLISFTNASAESNSQRSKMLTNTRHYLAQSHTTRDVYQQQLLFAPKPADLASR